MWYSRVKFRLQVSILFKLGAQHSNCISQYTFQYNYFILFPDKFIFHHFLKFLSNCCAYFNIILQLCVRPRMWNAYRLIATKSTFRKMKSRLQLFICLLTIICRNGELMIIKILIIGLPFIKLCTLTYTRLIALWHYLFFCRTRQTIPTAKAAAAAIFAFMCPQTFSV